MVQQLKGEIDFNKRRQAIADKLPPVKSGFFTMKEGIEGMEGINPASIDQKKRTDRNKHNIDIAEIGRQGVSGLAYAIGFLLVFQVVGFNMATMLARYRYYVLHEKKEGAGGSGGFGGPAFLGINEVDDNKETVFSETYCTGGTGGTDKKSDSVGSLGITAAGKQHTGLFGTYPYDNMKCSDLKELSFLNVNAVTMGWLRKTFKDSVGYYMGRGVEYNKTGERETMDTSMIGQISNPPKFLGAVALLILFIMLLPFIIIILGTSSGYASANEYDGMFGKMYGAIVGYIYGLINVIPLSLYGLLFALSFRFTGIVRRDTTPIYSNDPTKLFVPSDQTSISSYISSPTFFVSLMIWALGLIYGGVTIIPERMIVTRGIYGALALTLLYVSRPFMKSFLA